MRCYMALVLSSFAAASPQDPAPASRPTPDAAALRADLQSADAKTVIWAAHHARRLGDRSLVNPLQHALHAWRHGDDATTRSVRLYVLDSLHELRASMPATELVPLLETNAGTAAFSLLAREPRVNEKELLELLRRDWAQLIEERASPVVATGRELRALATANLLAGQNTPGLAALLAENLDLNLHVVVGREAPSQRWQRALNLARHHLAAEPDADLPPMPTYELVIAHGDQPHRKLLAPGVIDIQVVRSETKPARNAQLTTVTIKLPETLPATAVDGLTWLRQLAGSLPAPTRRLELELDDADSYRATVELHRDRLQQFVDNLRAQLLARGAVSAEQATLFERKVKVVVHDQRADKTQPLPRLPARD